MAAEQCFFRVKLHSRTVTSLDVGPAHGLAAKQAGGGVLALSLAVVAFPFVVDLLEIEEDSGQLDEAESVISCEQQEIGWHLMDFARLKSLTEFHNLTLHVFLAAISSQDIVIYCSLSQIS